MDKAEKLKAARKKLKEFQSHKQDVTTVQDATPETVEAETVSQQQQIVFSAFDPPPLQEASFQQQIPTFAASSTPQISNFFDNFNGQSFDNSHQQNLPQQNSQHQNSRPDNGTEFFMKPIAETGSQVELTQQMEQQILQIAQLRSEVDFHRSTATSLQKNIDELNKLRQDSHGHVEVVKVLVAEKSNLLDSLQKAESTVKTKIEENEELQNRLNVSRHRVKQLESDLRNSSGRSVHDQEVDQKKVEEAVAARIKEFKDSNAQIESDKNELKVLLNQKRIELENLQKNFDHLNTELHLANVKIAQLSDGAPLTDNINQPQLVAINQEVAIRQQQITELYSIIDQVNRDKEASDNQYQNYVSHLTREMETIKESSLELSNENDSLMKREQDLLKHVADLERQMQMQNQKQKTYAENQKESTVVAQSSDELQKLTSQISALTESNENLKSQLGKVEAERAQINQSLQAKLDEMKDMEMRMEQLKTNTPNLSQLMTDFEDKSVAASRALSQNQGLKEQLDEMQHAFIAMTNDKMELTSKLQTEMHLCKEMKTRYDSMEIELHEMKDKWQFKENEMIRLSHENTELEKKIFQQNIEIDRLRHYESKEYHGTEGILEKELENSKRLIETLSNKINILESQGMQQKREENNDHGHGHSHSHEGHSHSHDEGHNHESKDHSCESSESKKILIEEIEMLKMEKNELLKAINDFQMNKKSDKSPEDLINVTNVNEDALRKISVAKSVTPSMATEEALEKLQSRFRRTMLEVAELTEEKQRLEHVVTQLQFETETIGEYITLYQYQRRLLKQKEHERDVQLKSLAADREKMNDKLVQLNGLIEKFVLQHSDRHNIEFAKEASKFLDLENNSDPLIINQTENLQTLKQQTAGKILEILSEIKTANSTPYDTNVCVDHCSCCLGKLETV